MSAPITFLRLEQLRGEEVIEGMISDELVDHLVEMSDDALTRLLAGYCPEGTDVYLAATPAEFFRVATTYNISANWLAKAVKARVLDRWMEENA